MSKGVVGQGATLSLGTRFSHAGQSVPPDAETATFSNPDQPPLELLYAYQEFQARVGAAEGAFRERVRAVWGDSQTRPMPQPARQITDASFTTTPGLQVSADLQTSLTLRDCLARGAAWLHGHGDWDDWGLSTVSYGGLEAAGLNFRRTTFAVLQNFTAWPDSPQAALKTCRQPLLHVGKCR